MLVFIDLGKDYKNPLYFRKISQALVIRKMCYNFKR